MKLAGQLLLACVVMAALKACVAALLLALVLTLVAGLIFRPIETARTAVTILATIVFVGNPILCLVAVAVIVTAARFIVERRFR